MNLHELLAIPRQRTPQKTAIQWINDANGVTEMTYDQLYTAVDQLAAGLQKWGLQKGDRVAFFLSNCPEFLIAYLAVIRLGAIMVPINLRYRRLELGHILSDCTPRLLITERPQLVFLDDVGDEKQSLEAVLCVEELAQWQTDAANWQSPLVEADDLALVMYTSGTTGRSKGAMTTHNNVIATVTGLLAAWAWEQDDRLLLCLPLFHTHGLVVGAHCALATGATILLRPAFEAATTSAELLSGAATVFFAVPTIYVRLIDELRQPAKRDFKHMRLFCSGSAPLAPETHTAFLALTGHTILER